MAQVWLWCLSFFGVMILNDTFAVTTFTKLRATTKAYFREGNKLGVCNSLEDIYPFSTIEEATLAINRMNSQLAVTSPRGKACALLSKWRTEYINVAKVIDGLFVVQYPTNSHLCNFTDHTSCMDFLTCTTMIVEPVEDCGRNIECNCNALRPLRGFGWVRYVKSAACCFDTTPNEVTETTVDSKLTAGITSTTAQTTADTTTTVGISSTTETPIDCFAVIQQNGSVRIHWISQNIATAYCESEFLGVHGFLKNADALDSIRAAQQFMNISAPMSIHVEGGELIAKSNSNLITFGRNDAGAECMLNSVDTSMNNSMQCQQLNFTDDRSLVFFVQRSAAFCKVAEQCTPKTTQNKKSCCFEVGDYIHESDYNVDDCIDPSAPTGHFKTSTEPRNTNGKENGIGEDLTSESSTIDDTVTLSNELGTSDGTTLSTNGAVSAELIEDPPSATDAGALPELNDTSPSRTDDVHNNRTTLSNTTDMTQNRVRQIVTDKVLAQMTTFNPYYKFIPFIISLIMIVPLCVVDCMFHRD